MNRYLEVVVSRKITFQDKMMQFFSTVIPGTLAIYLLFLLTAANPVFRILFFIIAVGLFYVSYKMFFSFYIEWEYTLIDDEIVFSKIMNKSRRRDIMTVSLAKTKMLTKATDESISREVAQGIRKYHFLSRSDAPVYVLLTQTKQGKDVCVYMEPGEEMLSLIEKTIPRGRSRLS